MAKEILHSYCVPIWHAVPGCFPLLYPSVHPERRTHCVFLNIALISTRLLWVWWPFTDVQCSVKSSKNKTVQHSHLYFSSFKVAWPMLMIAFYIWEKNVWEAKSRNSLESLNMLALSSQQLSRLTQVSRKPKSKTLLTSGSFVLIQTEESRERTTEDGCSLEKDKQRPSEH